MSTSLPILPSSQAVASGETASLPVNTSVDDPSKAFANVLDAHLQPGNTTPTKADALSLLGMDASALMPISLVDGKKLPLDLSKADAVDGNALPLPADLVWSGMLIVNNGKGNGPQLYQLSSDGHSLTSQIDPNMKAQISQSLNQLSPLTTTELPEMLNITGKLPDNPLTGMKEHSLLFASTASPGANALVGQKFAEFLPASLLTDGNDTSTSLPSGDPASGTAGLQALGLAALSDRGGAHFPAVTQLHLSGDPKSPAWSQGLGERLQWLVQKDIQGADIRLNPPELGALEVKLKLSHDHGAQIHFSSPNGAVREAIEAAIPRLREMFAEAGMMLGDVNVSQQSFAQQQQNGDSHGNDSGRRQDSAGIAPLEAVSGDDRPSLQKMVSNGLVDMYV